jgi:endonuclease/exonuclease/phosphatase family metal-dependent hydrolase
MQRVYSSLWALLAAVIATAFYSNAAPAADAPPRVRILTYNIHHGEGVDGKFDLPRIAKVITSVKPDVVALQEVDKKTQRASGVDQAAELGKLTKMHAVFGKAMDYSGGEYGEAVLSRWPIESTRNVALPASEGHEPRAALSIRVKIPDTDITFTFIGTHLDHTRDPANRVAQMKKINEALVTGEHRDTPSILAGDLNAVPDSEPMKIAFEHWRDGSANDPQPTIPVVNPTRRIDYVLYRPASRWKVVETRVLDEQVASDHRPVLVVLEYVK